MRSRGCTTIASRLALRGEYVMQQTDETLHCTQCGKNISGSSSRFCDQCGSPVRLTVPPVAQQRAVFGVNYSFPSTTIRIPDGYN